MKQLLKTVLITISLLTITLTSQANTDKDCTGYITDKEMPKNCGFGDIILATNNGMAKFCDFTATIIAVKIKGEEHYMCFAIRNKRAVG